MRISKPHHRHRSLHAVDVNGVHPSDNLSALVQSAQTSSRLLRLWFDTDSHSRYSAAVVATDIDAVAKQYVKAVEASGKAVKHGIALADDAISLYGYLSRHPNTDVRSFVEDMRILAERAHDDANDMYERFRVVQSTLDLVASQIPSMAVQIKTDYDSTLVQDDLPKYSSDCSTQILDHQQLCNFQQDAVATVESLQKATADLCMWWLSVKAVIYTFLDEVVSADGVVQERWEVVKKDYVKYKTSVLTLMVFFPHIDGDEPAPYVRRCLPSLAAYYGNIVHQFRRLLYRMQGLHSQAKGSE